MKYEILFSSYQLGRLLLKNRAVMAPMTRNRSIGNIPGDIVAKYYAQRAEAGLIITEGISPSPNGLGYPRIPGLFSEAQTTAWRKATDGVHDKGGAIFAQLMHTGRVGHPLNLPDGAQVMAPSSVAMPDPMYTDAQGPQPCPAPKEMTEADIETAQAEYVHAAKNAVTAGFDGVELHGANGYLIDQFINTASNHRKDGWGESVEGRTRFALTVARRTVSAVGGEKVGIRLSPAGGFNGMTTDADTPAVYAALAEGLADIGVAYIHLVDHSAMGAPKPPAELVRRIRASFPGALILSGGYDAARAEDDLSSEDCDLVAFGRPFIANPNLVTKLKADASLRDPDPNTFYTPGEKGYTDYPAD